MVHVTLVVLVLGVNWLSAAATSEASNKHLVLLLSRLGLANRLRAMADWHQIAMESGRHLTVSWEPTWDCNASFWDLFEAVPAGMTVLAEPLASGEGRLARAAERARLDAEGQGLRFQLLPRDDTGSGGFIQEGFDTFVVSRAAMFQDTQVLFTDHDGLVALAGVPCQRYGQLRSEFYMALQPARDIAEYVEKVHATYFAHKVMVGVHVRQHDTDYDWSVVPPGRVLNDDGDDGGGSGGAPTEVEGGGASSSQQQQQQHQQPQHQQKDDEGGDAPSAALPFGEGAPPSMFRETMLAIEGAFRQRYGQPSMSTPRLERGVLEEDAEADSPVRFFVASNDQATKDYFIAHFPAAIALAGPTSIGGERHSRATPANIRFALIEWLLLARSTLILHTYGSSFAEEAAARHKVPLVGAWADVNVLHHHTALPHCGFPQFMRAYADQGWHGHIEEDLRMPGTTGTMDASGSTGSARTVTGKSFLILPCPMLSDFAIPRLYCFQDDVTAAAME